MKVKIIGKCERQGTSKKTGNPYHFIEVHYNGPARGVVGLAAKSTTFDPTFYPFEQIQVGQEYVMEFDNSGYLVEFSPILQNKG